MGKKKFKCICGHKEEHHNFDPDSAFFGCCEKFIATYNEITGGEGAINCDCDEFRPDNLKYLEELSER